MSPERTTSDTRRVYRLSNGVLIEMPQAYIVIFLLFFAVLAFGWFYWQRAKGRTVVDTSVEQRTDTTPASTDPAD